jgi:hypothetical protein
LVLLGRREKRANKLDAHSTVTGNFTKNNRRFENPQIPMLHSSLRRKPMGVDDDQAGKSQYRRDGRKITQKDYAKLKLVTLLSRFSPTCL